MERIVFNSTPKTFNLGNNITIHGQIITDVIIPKIFIEDLMQDDELTHIKVLLPPEALTLKMSIPQVTPRKKINRVIDLKARNTIKLLLTQKPVPGPTRKGLEK